MSTLTEAQVLPDQVEARLPMVPEVVGEAVDALIVAVMRAWGLPVHIRALGDAGRAVADELLQQADAAWSTLTLSVERDDLDVYVRLSTDVPTGVEPSLTPATRDVVALVTASHHVAIEGTRALIVLQASLR